MPLALHANIRLAVTYTLAYCNIELITDSIYKRKHALYLVVFYLCLISANDKSEGDLLLQL